MSEVLDKQTQLPTLLGFFNILDCVCNGHSVITPVFNQNPVIRYHKAERKDGVTEVQFTTKGMHESLFFTFAYNGSTGRYYFNHERHYLNEVGLPATQYFLACDSEDGISMEVERRSRSIEKETREDTLQSLPTKSVEFYHGTLETIGTEDLYDNLYRAIELTQTNAEQLSEPFIVAN